MDSLLTLLISVVSHKMPTNQPNIVYTKNLGGRRYTSTCKRFTITNIKVIDSMCKGWDLLDNKTEEQVYLSTLKECKLLATKWSSIKEVQIMLNLTYEEEWQQTGNLTSRNANEVMEEIEYLNSKIQDFKESESDLQKENNVLLDKQVQLLRLLNSIRGTCTSATLDFECCVELNTKLNGIISKIETTLTAYDF